MSAAWVRLAGLVMGVAATWACAAAPAPVLVPEISYDDKLSWILRLEDERILRDGSAGVSAAPPAPGTPAPAAAAMPQAPDLLRLLGDRDARVRRRAAIAAGRVRLPDATPALITALGDPDPDVRQAVAFALGLIGDARAHAALVAALGDADLLVRGRAAEALGLAGASQAVPAVSAMVFALVQQGALNGVEPDDERESISPATDALRLGILALTRLEAVDALSSTLLDERGLPRSRWWPVAYAFQRVGHPKAVAVLRHLVDGAGVYGPAFAIRGLGEHKDAASVEALLPLVSDERRDLRVRVAAVRALAAIGDRRAVAPLVRLLATYAALDRSMLLEVIAALGALEAREATDLLLDLVRDRWPAVRGAVLGALSRIDPFTFTTIASTLDEDAEWTVRAAFARALTTIEPDAARLRLEAMLADSDARVIPAVLRALARVGSPTLDDTLLTMLAHRDDSVRATAATLLGERNVVRAFEALRAAFETGATDAAYGPRAAMLEAMAAIDAAAAHPSLERALADKDWAVRVRAAALLSAAGGTPDASARSRPAPVDAATRASYATPELVSPPFSPRLYVETSEGTIEIELAVLDAPQTSRTIMALARSGFYAGLRIHRVVPNFVVQMGDPRGDGEGGPGYTVRDELNTRPYVRGTVGMALDWADTGGSQFFITHSPQPHLDGRYTAFGRVVAGMDVVDRLAVDDTLVRVRVWDGINAGDAAAVR